MAYWEILDVGSDYFKVGIRELEKPFNSDNYIRIVFTREWCNEAPTSARLTEADVFLCIFSGIDANSFETIIDGSKYPYKAVEPNTEYDLYCYAQVNDANDNNKYYIIRLQDGETNFIRCKTRPASYPTPTPDEPSLTKRYEWDTTAPSAMFLCTNLTNKNAGYIFQARNVYSGDIYQAAFMAYHDPDLIDDSGKFEMTLTDFLGDNSPEYCTEYELRVGAVWLDDNLYESKILSDYDANWSGWATYTTQPSRALLNHIDVSLDVRNIKVSTMISILPYEYSHIWVWVNGVLKAQMNANDISASIALDAPGEYEVDVSASYTAGSAEVFCTKRDGSRAYLNTTIYYEEAIRPDRFSWTTEPASGISVASVPYSDWNALCANVLSVIRTYKGRGDITIPNDINLYGDMSGRGIFEVLSNTETTSKKGIKISSDKTLYAWRYNALNYIICCVENSDYETDVTNSDYSEHFSSGMPVYARYLTALSDKVNSIE